MNREQWNTKMFDAALALALEENLDRDLQSAQAIIDDSPTYELSDEFKSKMKRLMAKANRQEKLRGVSQIAKSAAIIILMLAAIGFGAAMSVHAVRVQLWNTIVELTEQYTGFRFEADTPASSMSVYRPTYVPEGFTEISCEEALSGFIVTYRDENGHEIFFEQYAKDDGLTLQIDNEERTIVTKTVRGYNLMISVPFQKEDNTFVIWETEELFFMLSSSISSDELVLMADSVLENFS